MKFRVRRTSQWSGDPIAPCKGSYKDSYIPVDVRTYDDPAKIPFYKGEVDWWYNEGCNHRLIDGQIARDMSPREGWFVELDSLTSLIDFVKEWGRIVIGETQTNPPMFEVEIYDDYRE